MVKILYEDSINSYKADMLQRCAVKIPVSINMYEYGDWIDLDDGGKLWQLSLIAKDAKSLDITFNKFWIPKGGKFFVFNPNTNETIGAVTSEYLLGNRESPHRFSTGIIKGDIITLEYYQPQSVEELPVIELSGIFYGYRVSNNKSLGFGYSGSCNINVNCAEGADWQFEKKAVARIYIKLTNDAGWCTGSLLNNTNNDFSPLFLTANHCLVGASETKDAITNPDASDWIFYWDYETECSGSNSEPQSKTTVGAVIKANNNYYSDFALLRLIQDPRNLSGFTPQYLGWDVSGNSGYQGACIQHPKGDVKKISIVANTPTSTDYLNYFINTAGDSWRVTWEDGVTEPGSSGAPLFNSTHSVIGQLHGGNSSCDNPTGSDWYGKLSLSWTGNGNTDSRRRLIDWLDPNNTGITIQPSSFDINIFGENKIYNSNVYTTFSMSNGYSVNWSLSGGNASCYTVHNNTPSTNQCTVTLKDSVDFVNTNDLVLNAQIKYGSTVITTVTKPLTPVYIYGPTVPYSTEMYEVNNLPDDCTVSWNWSGTGLTIDNTPVLVEPYYSTNNYFKLVRNNLDYARGTLTATINRSGNTVATISKTLDTGVNFSGTWYQGLNSPSTLTCGNTYAISGSQVVLQFDNFIGRTMTYSCNGMLLFGGVSHSGNTISFTPILPALKGDEPNANPGFSNSITITVTDATTHEAFKFTFYIEPQHPLNPPILSMAVSGNEYTFTYDEASESRQAWTLEVVKIDTGQQVYSGTTDNASQTVRTSNWQSGIYAALVRRNGQIVATQKMTIK